MLSKESGKAEKTFRPCHVKLRDPTGTDGNQLEERVPQNTLWSEA